VVHQHFVMEVRPRGAACCSHITNHLTLLDSLADFDRDAAHMSIGRVKVATVADLDIISIRAETSGPFNFAVTRRINGSPRRSGEVDPFVHLAVTKDRVAAHTETGGQTRA